MVVPSSPRAGHVPAAAVQQDHPAHGVRRAGQHAGRLPGEAEICDVCIRCLQTSTRNYARRQITWLRAEPRSATHRIDCGADAGCSFFWVLRGERSDEHVCREVMRNFTNAVGSRRRHYVP